MSPTNPPDGGKARQPWLALGRSRATWYRRGKPSEKPQPRLRQKDIAEILGVSVRTVQRDRAAERAKFIAKMRAYMAKGHSFEEAFRLANADAQSQAPAKVAQS